MHSFIPGKTRKLMAVCIEVVKLQENFCLSLSVSGKQQVLCSNYTPGIGNHTAVSQRNIFLVIIPLHNCRIGKEDSSPL